ncbi:kinase-like domain-containing protein [Pisolithus albus]|nr:kinase-like domain-containing protein [Pisolithus albus]
MRHTFDAAGTTFTVDNRYQAFSGSGRHHLGSELTVAVWDKTTGENRVIRKFSNVSQQLAEAKRCLREIRFLRHFKGHDNIVRLYDFEMNFQSNGDFDEVYFIEEYLETDLRKIIRLECPLAGMELLAFAHQILRGVNYIHSAGVVLQDLSPDNILISEAGAVKIAGLGKVSPSLATTVYKIFELTGLPSEPALSAIADAELRDYALSIGSITRIPLSKRVPNADPRLLDLLTEVFSLDVDSRITCKDALSHKYLDDVRCHADGFVCFPYKGSLDEEVSHVSQAKVQLVKELRSFYALQHDDTMELSLPELDFRTNAAARPSKPPSPITPSKGVASSMHAACSPSDMSALCPAGHRSPAPPSRTEAEISEKDEECQYSLCGHVSKGSWTDSVIPNVALLSGMGSASRLRFVVGTLPDIRDASLDASKPPTLQLGAGDIGDDFGQAVKSSLAEAGTAIQRPALSRHASSVAQFTALLDIRKTSTYPHTGGAFGDIWKCYWFRDSEEDGLELVRLLDHALVIPSDTMKVAVKAMRTNIMSDKPSASGFTQQWSAHGHPTAHSVNIYNYITPHFLWLEKFQILDDVASGLRYLHKNHVTHGDLTGNNVLIFGDGRAVLADFGMSTALKELWGSAYFTESARGTLRWAAPELFQCNEDGITGFAGPPCDVYSFGSIILQVISGKAPYSYLNSDTQVVGMVVRGIRPERPSKPRIADEQWDIIQWCWSPDATQRP